MTNTMCKPTKQYRATVQIVIELNCESESAARAEAFNAACCAQESYSLSEICILDIVSPERDTLAAESQQVALGIGGNT